MSMSLDMSLDDMMKVKHKFKGVKKTIAKPQHSEPKKNNGESKKIISMLDGPLKPVKFIRGGKGKGKGKGKQDKQNAKGPRKSKPEGTPKAAAPGGKAGGELKLDMSLEDMMKSSATRKGKGKGKAKGQVKGKGKGKGKVRNLVRNKALQNKVVSKRVIKTFTKQALMKKGQRRLLRQAKGKGKGKGEGSRPQRLGNARVLKQNRPVSRRVLKQARDWAVGRKGEGKGKGKGKGMGKGKGKGFRKGEKGKGKGSSEGKGSGEGKRRPKMAPAQRAVWQGGANAWKQAVIEVAQESKRKTGASSPGFEGAGWGRMQKGSGKGSDTWGGKGGRRDRGNPDGKWLNDKWEGDRGGRSFSSGGGTGGGWERDRTGRLVPVDRMPARRTRSPEPPKSSRSSSGGETKIRVTGIPRGLDWRDIKDAFEDAAGRVTRCTMEGSTAWLSFTSHHDAMKAVKTFDYGELNGKTITVKLD